MEVEISQFLNGPRNGRLNYYGTVLLYIVGQGIVPWAEGKKTWALMAALSRAATRVSILFR